MVERGGIPSGQTHLHDSDGGGHVLNHSHTVGDEMGGKRREDLPELQALIVGNVLPVSYSAGRG